jgi:hypothetical protein
MQEESKKPWITTDLSEQEKITLKQQRGELSKQELDGSKEAKEKPADTSSTETTDKEVSQPEQS